MKVVVTFDVDEKNLDDLVVMAKVYRKKDGYKEFVFAKNNLSLKQLQKLDYKDLTWCNQDNIEGWNDCIDEIIGGKTNEVTD